MGLFHANTETISNLYTICVGTCRISQLPIKANDALDRWKRWKNAGRMREWKKEQDAISYSVANAEQPTHTNENGRDRKRTKQPKYEI